MGAINLKKSPLEPVPVLASMELVHNCFGTEFCQGHFCACAFEWIIRNEIGEDDKMPYEMITEKEQMTPGSRADGTHHTIDDWKYIREEEREIKSQTAIQPVVIGLNVPSAFNSEYKEGLINVFLMNAVGTVEHVVVIVGFGVFICEDGEIINIWKAKNTAGSDFAYNGYLYLIRNSSLPASEWRPLFPIIPIKLGQGEKKIVDGESLVKDMSLDELSQYDSNTHLELIILFYDTSYRRLVEIKKDFERVAKLYATDEDIIVASVDVTNEWTKCIQKYGINRKKNQKHLPVLWNYKYDKDEVVRDLKSGGNVYSVVAMNFFKIAGHLLRSFGGKLAMSAR